MSDENPLFTITKSAKDGLYGLSFAPGSIAELGSALRKARRKVNGYTVEAVLQFLAEKGDPDWAGELEFDSERNLFCVRCKSKAPITKLIHRLEKRIADPSAMRRLVRAVPESLFEDVVG